MKKIQIHSNPFYIEINTDSFFYLLQKIIGYKYFPKAAAFYPFVFLSSKIDANKRDYFINHELIHLAQQKEMLVFFFYIFYIFEYIFLKTVKRKSGHDLYISRSIEQEAYLNMFDVNYLEKRKSFSFLNYFNKPALNWNELSIQLKS